MHAGRRARFCLEGQSQAACIPGSRPKAHSSANRVSLRLARQEGVGLALKLWCSETASPQFERKRPCNWRSTIPSDYYVCLFHPVRVSQMSLNASLPISRSLCIASLMILTACINSSFGQAQRSGLQTERPAPPTRDPNSPVTSRRRTCPPARTLRQMWTGTSSRPCSQWCLGQVGRGLCFERNGD